MGFPLHEGFIMRPNSYGVSFKCSLDYIDSSSIFSPRTHSLQDDTISIMNLARQAVYNTYDLEDLVTNFGKLISTKKINDKYWRVTIHLSGLYVEAKLSLVIDAYDLPIFKKKRNKDV